MPVSYEVLPSTVVFPRSDSRALRPSIPINKVGQIRASSQTRIAMKSTIYTYVCETILNLLAGCLPIFGCPYLGTSADKRSKQETTCKVMAYMVALVYVRALGIHLWPYGERWIPNRSFTNYTE